VLVILVNSMENIKAKQKNIILEVKNLEKDFVLRQKLSDTNLNILKAVNNVSFSLYKGETLGIVGESGCGKSTLARCILRLIEPTKGSVRFLGKNILSMPKEEMRQLRKKIQIIFQDPFSTLNSKMSVGKIISEPWAIFKDIVPKKNWDKKIKELLISVGLNIEDIDRFPHQFSGGQQQRIGIARALALNPEVIICDEPVSALDVSIQAQIINLLKEIQSKTNISLIFISHDLSVVQHISNRVGVMYSGEFVEFGDVNQIFQNPKHSYTKSLLSAAPTLDFSKKKK
jgi:oligopeptide transport system ATP-binding protein